MSLVFVIRWSKYFHHSYCMYINCKFISNFNLCKTRLIIKIKRFSTFSSSNLIQVYPHKWEWPDLPHSNSNLSNSHSPSHSLQGIRFQTNTLALLLHLHLPHLLCSSSLHLKNFFLFGLHVLEDIRFFILLYLIIYWFILKDFWF